MSEEEFEAIKAAIACLEDITYSDGKGRRRNSYQDWVDLNEPDKGNVQSVIDRLRALK